MLFLKLCFTHYSVSVSRLTFSNESYCIQWQWCGVRCQHNINSVQERSNGPWMFCSLQTERGSLFSTHLTYSFFSGCKFRAGGLVVLNYTLKLEATNFFETWVNIHLTVRGLNAEICILTHWGRVTQICVLHYNCARRMTQMCVFNMRLFSLHNTLNYAIHRACLRMVLLTDVYRNLTSLWIKL